MQSTPATSAANLRTRVLRYLRADGLSDRRRLVLDVLPTFEALGRVAIVGGMLRDIALAGPGGYASDIDLVVQPDDANVFREAAVALGGVANRFGGYGMSLGGWSVDVWALEDTWAHRAGLIDVRSFADLRRCTFFDWDAVTYEPRTGRLATNEGFFDGIRERVLGINLAVNPNSAGCAVRAIRRAARWGASLTDPLACFVLREIDHGGWTALVALDETAFDLPLLRDLDPSDVRKRLETRKRHGDRYTSEPIVSHLKQVAVFQ